MKNVPTCKAMPFPIYASDQCHAGKLKRRNSVMTNSFTSRTATSIWHFPFS